MARKNNAGDAEAMPSITVSGQRVWLHAQYHAHLFHYRMPETVAIAAVSPLIPSPLTVKMALIAALARYGDIEGAQELTDYLPYLNADTEGGDEPIRLIPPPGAVTFKAFMRYARPPAPPRKGESSDGRDANTGGTYSVSPHMREFALWQGELGVLIHCPEEAQVLVERALWNITYLGAKDSQVSCQGVCVLTEEPTELLKLAIREIRNGDDFNDATGPIFRFADFKPGRAPELHSLIPFNRNSSDYRLGFYMLPGTLNGSGRAKIYVRKDRT